MLRTLGLTLALLLMAAPTQAAIEFRFTPHAGGTQTLLEVSGSATALDNFHRILGINVPFNLVDTTSFSSGGPFPGLVFEGSSSGSLAVIEITLDPDPPAGAPNTDDFSVYFNSNLSQGETITASGSHVLNFAFSNILEGGMPNNVAGAEHVIVVGDAAIPEPSTYLTLSGLILCFGLAGWWRKRRKAA